MKNNFFAMVSRMRYINRWALMRNTISENIEEHSLQVAIVAHAIAVIRNKFYSEDESGKKRIYVNPDFVASLSLYHDTNEILTGDMPTPVKYFNSTITDAYKAVEQKASERLLAMLPEELAGEYRGLLSPDTNDPEIAEAVRIVKSADKISALIKCIEEEKAGNKEFLSAKKKLTETVSAINLPEVQYFIKNFLPAYSKTLDELEN